MQFQSLIIAFAAASLAGAQDINSIVSVLETAIPSSVIQQFQTDQAGFVSSVESQARAGETPSWFQDLPSDVKSFLGLAATGSVTLTGDGPEETGDDDSTQSSGNDVTVTGATDSPTGAGGAQVSVTTSTSGGGAAPTQIVGMGLAGAMGLFGLMAL